MSTSDINDLILSNLQVLLDKYRKEKDKYRITAYSNAIRTIKALSKPIIGVVKDKILLEGEKDPIKLPGIGAKTAKKIEEILGTGKLGKVEKIAGGDIATSKIITLFTKIWGVGPIKAKELYNLGARSIQDIREKFQNYLTENQKIGLKYFEDLQKRIPRIDIEPIVRILTYKIHQLEHSTGWDIKMRVCGSFRRRSETLGDMDILVAEKNNKNILPDIIDTLMSAGILIENLAIGPTKYMGLTRTASGTYFRIDIEVVKIHEWPFALLYFTGSGKFNEQQRLVAKKMGYSMSEHGLAKIGTRKYVQGINSEREIFKFLGMKYIPPWDRR